MKTSTTVLHETSQGAFCTRSRCFPGQHEQVKFVLSRQVATRIKTAARDSTTTRSRSRTLGCVVTGSGACHLENSTTELLARCSLYLHAMCSTLPQVDPASDSETIQLPAPHLQFARECQIKIGLESAQLLEPLVGTPPVGPTISTTFKVETPARISTAAMDCSGVCSVSAQTSADPTEPSITIEMRSDSGCICITPCLNSSQLPHGIHKDVFAEPAFSLLSSSAGVVPLSVLELTILSNGMWDRQLASYALSSDVPSKVSATATIFNATNFEKLTKTSPGDYDILHSTVQAFGDVSSLRVVLKEIEKTISLLQVIPKESEMGILLRSNKLDMEDLERILIALLGHPDSSIRAYSSSLLHSIYDGHNWQLNGPLTVQIACENEPCIVEVPIDGMTLHDSIGFIIASPSKDLGTPCSWSWHSAHVTSGKARILCHFQEPGFYDWRLSSFQVNETGYNTLDNDEPCGRIIIFPSGTRLHALHQVVPLIEKASWNPVTGKILQSGSLRSVGLSIPEYKKTGTSLAVLSCSLTGESPTSAFNRTTLSNSIGGNSAFKALSTTAQASGLGLVLDVPLSTVLEPHTRDFSQCLIYSIRQGSMVEPVTNMVSTAPACSDDSDLKSSTPSDKGAGKYVDSQSQEAVFLNFRSGQCWYDLLRDLDYLASQNFSGVRLVGPAAKIFPSDEREMFRKDIVDGEYHYPLSTILESPYVKKGEGSLLKLNSGNYPNPLLVKVVRQLWKKYPHFLIFSGLEEADINADCCSGVIPFSSEWYKAVASFSPEAAAIKFGAAFQPRGLCISDIISKLQTLPPGAIFVNTLATIGSPYPCFLFKEGSWPAVDACLLSSGLPCTFIGEHQGCTLQSLDAATGSIGVSNVESKPAICGNYEHRIYLRRKQSSLTNSGILSLPVMHNEGIHNHVFAFGRFGCALGGSIDEVVVVAVNMSPFFSPVYMDFSPLANILTDKSVRPLP
ncbi:starch synthase [Pelomyxa schiedti]|nr:starch synthase [Pelomyxa schiedti]